MKIFPGMGLARYHLAHAYARAGRQDQAKAEFHRFLQLWAHGDPNLPETSMPGASLAWASN